MNYLSIGTGFSTTLKQTEMPIIDRNKCNSTGDITGFVTDNMICAGVLAGGVDACQVKHLLTINVSCSNCLCSLYMYVKTISVFSCSLTLHAY